LLKAKDSHGYDDISVIMLKLFSPFISSPLNYICNELLSSGILPCRLQYAEVVPLFKKGDKKDMLNYKPIFFFYCCTMHFEICRVHSPTNALFGFKNTLKFTLKYT